MLLQPLLLGLPVPPLQTHSPGCWGSLNGSSQRKGDQGLPWLGISP